MNKQGQHGITWTDQSWAVVNGCRRYSPGCENCYAERLAATRLVQTPKYKGLAVFGQNGPRWTGESRLWIHELDAPLRLRKPSKIFVADMGDLFFEGVTNEEIAAVFGVMAFAPQHTFQVLTKRAKRMREWYGWLTRAAMNANGGRGMTERGLLACLAQKVCDHPRLRQTDTGLAGSWPLHNVWLGVSVEDQKRADERIPYLLATPAAVRWLSVEPQLEALTPQLEARPDRDDGPADIDWVVQGGESGPGARPFDLAWARSMRQQCEEAGAAYFFKQAGANVRDGGASHHLQDGHGGEMSEWPVDLRVRQYPTTP